MFRTGYSHATKKPTKPIKSELTPTSPVRVGQIWVMDILGPLKESYAGNKYLLVFMEYATKWAEVFPLAETKAHIIARHFVDGIVFRYSAPKHLLSDMGTQMVAQVVNEASQLVGTQRLVMTPYRPTTDGTVERFNYSLTKQLSSYVDSTGRDWDKYTKPVSYVYNVSVCVESTHFQPFYLMLGRAPRCPLSISLPDVPDVPGIVNKDYIKNLVTGLSHAHNIAQKNMAHHKQKMKEQYDRKAYPVDFEVGQRVWIYFPTVKVGKIKKFKKIFSGPYIITENVREKNFRVGRGHDLKPLRNMVHIDRMKPFIDGTIRPPCDEEIQEILNNDDDADDLVEEDKV